MLVCWLVAKGNIQIKVSMSRLPVYCMSQGAVRSPVNICVREGDVAISFSLLGELYVVMNIDEVDQEVI